MNNLPRCKNCFHYKSTCPYPDWMSESLEQQIEEMIEAGVEPDGVICDNYFEESDLDLNIYGI